MSVYHLLSLTIPNNIHIYTTDAKTIDNLYLELKRIFPTARLDWEPLPPGQVVGEKNHAQLYQLSNRERYALWWMMKRLGELSWEPFQIDATGYYFRRVVTSDVFTTVP